MVTLNSGSSVLDIHNFPFKTQIYYGADCSKLTGKIIDKYGIENILVITDKGVNKAGLPGNALKSLQERKIRYEIFDEVVEDADVNIIHNIALLLRSLKCKGVLVIGGGSPICAAKGAALESTNNVKTIRELEGRNKAENAPLPVFCIPTTAGSGSDVVSGYPVLDIENKRHFGISGDTNTPVISILDPVLLKNCPSEIMVYAGIDAFCHAIEALWSAHSTLLTDMLAYDAIKIVMENLKEAAFTENLGAKLNQQIAATIGMITGESGGMGIIHGLSQANFTVKGSHGYKCGVLLPPVMSFNLPVCRDKFAHLEEILVPRKLNRRGATLAESFVERVKEFLSELNFPRRFDDLTTEKIPEFVKEARRCSPDFFALNLRQASDDDLAGICEAAIKGW